MSIFSESIIKLNKSEVIQLVSVSHNQINPSIAVSTNNKIMLYNDNGEKYDYELARSITPTGMDWHPSQALLAIGWENGTITLWNDEQKNAKEETSVHRDPVNMVMFNPTGSRMVSADHKGLVVVWRGINALSTYQKEGIMTHCIFAELNNLIKSNNLFFFGGKSGVVCLADDSKHCSDVCKVGGSIKSLLIYEKENSVIIITSSLLLVQFKISTTEKNAPDKKVKLSIAGDVEQLQSIWIGSCLLATVSYENMIRMWHLQQDDNYVLTLHDLQEMSEDQTILNDKIACIAYDNSSKILIAGTKEGRILFWKNLTIGSESPQDSDQWRALPFMQMEKSVQGISIGRSNGLLVVRSSDTVKIISQTQVKGKMSENIRILQIDSNKVLIYIKADNQNKMFLFESKFIIKSLDCTDQYLMVQGSKKIEIHEIITTQQDPQIKLLNTIEEKCIKAAIHGENIIIVNDYNFNITNFKGVVKFTFSFSETDGYIQSFYIMGKTMVAWSINNYFRIYDLGRREYRQIGVTRRFENSDGPLGRIRQCCCNSDGTKIGILADALINLQQPQNGSLVQLDRIYIYDMEMDNFSFYELDEGRSAIDMCWDQVDNRLFGVVTEYSKGKVQQQLEGSPIEQVNVDESDKNLSKGMKIYTFFFTNQSGIKLQDEYQLEKQQEGLFAVKIPYLILVSNNQNGTGNGSSAPGQAQTFRIQDRLMNDFIGLEKADDATKKAVVNFSFHLSAGNLDEAYKSVKSIQNPTVWEKMAQMSVKNRRLDVAEICIGNMKFARGAKAIRESKKETELDAQLAMVAVQLGMLSEAEKLYSQCKRWDLLNKMYQSSGDWKKAIEIAEKYDRINLKSTYYKHARNLEISEEYEQAIEFYEKSETYAKEVPRMFLEASELDRLEDYVELKKDKALYKWWANYLESQNKFDSAVKYYKLSEDYQSLTRILIFQGDLKQAKEICLEKNDPAACYYLAKQFEVKELILEAIHFYGKAQYYSQAVKLAKERNMDSEVMSLSLQGPKQIMVQSAIYFQEKGLVEKAVTLFMKGGQLKKALYLATKSKLNDYVKKINQEIMIYEQQQEALAQIKETPQQSLQQSQQPNSTSTNNNNNNNNNNNYNNANLQQKQQQQLYGQIIGQSSEGEYAVIRQFLSNQQYEKALDYCVQQNITITPELVQIIAPSQPLDNPSDEKKRRELLLMIAEKAKKMGNHDLASKIFIQLGERVKAVKALIKLGDVEKVITFANNARMSEIYVLAGNYLQTGDWHKDPELMKHIIQFYNKAKAFDHLAGFFDACSTVEIDEYRDYDKACAALREALKHANKSLSEDKATKIQQIQSKLTYIDQFIQAKSLYQTNPQEMLRICQQLLANQNIEYAIRAGDIHATLVEYYYELNHMDQAYQEIQQMQRKGIVLNPYLDQEIIQNILNSVGQKNNKQQYSKYQQQQQEQLNEVPFQEEEVIDDDI